MNQLVEFKALECKQNNRTFYLSIVPNRILDQVCYVSRRDEEPQQGFQRTLNKSRASDIANYLDERKGTIPSALILSAQDVAKLSFDKRRGQISFVTNQSSFMVLDGQHRLYGLLLSKNTYDVPVVIFNKLTSSDEVNLFIDINTTQKGVPTTLLLDIKNLTGKETKLEERQRLLFDRLNKDSVLAGLLSPTKSQVGKITRLTFNSATKEIFEEGFFQTKDDLTVYKGVKNYLEAAEITFNKSKSTRARLTNTNLFKAVFSIFKIIVDKSLKTFGDLKVESLTNSLDPISRIEFDSYTGTGNAAVAKVVRDMKNELDEYERIYRDVSDHEIF